MRDRQQSNIYLLVENRLCLSTVAGLLTIIPAFSLYRKAILALLVLGNLMQRVLPAFLVLAISFLCLRDIHLRDKAHVINIKTPLEINENISQNVLTSRSFVLLQIAEDCIQIFTKYHTYET